MSKQITAFPGKEKCNWITVAVSPVCLEDESVCGNVHLWAVCWAGWSCSLWSDWDFKAVIPYLGYYFVDIFRFFPFLKIYFILFKETVWLHLYLKW